MKLFKSVPLVIITLLFISGCSGDPHRKILLSDRDVYSDQQTKRGKIAVFLSKDTREFIIDVIGTGMRSGARYTIYAGKALEANAPLSLKKIASNVSRAGRPGGPGTVLQIEFGSKTALVPGQANFSASEVTIELVCRLYEGGRKVLDTKIVKSAKRNSALGFCSPLLIIRKQIIESYDKAIAEAGSESLKQALEELNAQIIKSGVRF